MLWMIKVLQETHPDDVWDEERLNQCWNHLVALENAPIKVKRALSVVYVETDPTIVSAFDRWRAVQIGLDQVGLGALCGYIRGSYVGKNIFRIVPY